MVKILWGGVKTTAYFDAAAGQWKPANTGIAPYGKCETEKHTDLILGGDLSSADGSLRLFWIKSGAADNEFARIPTHSGLTVDPPPEPTFEVASDEDAIRNWNYTLDNTNNIVTLNYYTGNETEVIVWGSYPIGGKTYTTRLKSNTEGATYSTTPYYMFNAWRPSGLRNGTITKITFSNTINTSNVTNMACMFYGCINLQSLDVSGFDTSKVTSMASMFAGCNTLITLDLSKFDTSNVTDMQNMFNGCKSLPSLDVSHFNTAKVENMGYMFYYCESFTSLNVSNLDTSNVTDMQSMFGGCSSLTFLDLSNKFNTSNVTNMNHMFSICSALTTLDLSNFDTSNVTDMRHMFNKSKSLTTLDLSNFNTSNVDDMRHMFYGCTNLTTLQITPGKWVRKSGCIVDYMIYDSGLSSSSIPPTV